MSRLNGPRAALLAVGLLLGSYVVYRRHAAWVGVRLGKRLPLRKALSQLPLVFGDWRGADVPLEEGVADIAGADDYVSREYRNARTGEMLSLYVNYYGSPRVMVGHYPDVCYPAFGWKRELRRADRIRAIGAAANEAWPAVVYRFKKGSDRVTVVSFFNVGGQYTADREMVRRAAHGAIGSENKNYLAQVQLSLPGRPSMKRTLRITGGFLTELLPQLEDVLPDSAVGESPTPQE